MTDPVAFNPLHGNPLSNRREVAQAVTDLFTPLLPYFSEGGARVRLSATGSLCDRAAADLEGFARPLWGIVPLVAGGGVFDHWPLYRKGLVNGMNPDHSEYWGDLMDRDQRLVELAAIGLALALTPEHIYEPLTTAEKQIVADYLLAARQRPYVDNNWKFFRVLVDLGLERVGIAFDTRLTHAFLDELEAFEIGDGWYRDGPVRRTDHYIPFAMHYYGLIYAVLARGDADRCDRFRSRARRFAQDIQHWFGPDGAALAFGRSQTYRFAAGGFWGALAYANLEALPWPVIKGHYLRHLRWWADKPIAERDGILSIGYGYPNLLMSESYNSPGSPYWALKVFLPLALGDDHPFWRAKEAAAPAFSAPVALDRPGMVAMHTPGNVVLLSSGQQHERMRGAAEKYAKFAYSTRYGFAVEADDRHFAAAGFDNMLGLSKDGVHLRMREDHREVLIAGTTLYSRWAPWPDVTVETWLLPASPWHIRVHKIVAAVALETSEGGFAIEKGEPWRVADRVEPDPKTGSDRSESGSGRAFVWGPTDVSAIVDLAHIHPRQGHVISPIANSHLIHAKTLVPQLRGRLAAGETLLMSAVLALPHGEDARAALDAPPQAPDVAALMTAIRTHGRRVASFDL